MSFTGTTSGGVAYGESKVCTTANNIIVQFQIVVSTKHETPQAAGLTLWGSPDNVNWYRVDFNKIFAPSYVHISKSPSYTYSGTYPAITQPALGVNNSSGSVWTAADTIAVGSGLSAGTAVSYIITLYNPSFNYYKWGASVQGSANTNAKVTSFRFRSFTRKVY
ncbi:MAG: hypothetical protein EKK63_02345 [Acinetobacter sp.]|uniref:hypothetical protein n=1 Tax=Acinetobacter sp. TaxID=472 RepID=UPI000FA77145|nr:hypothetical protein [Acinetobacter sp.]RUP42157.1 MAG: hypothetical protein EKK63_02345 [Acinetobacter sp.]